MSRFAIAIALVVLPGAAIAQEQDWTGFYAGLGIGGKNAGIEVDHHVLGSTVGGPGVDRNYGFGEPVSSVVSVHTAHVLAGYRTQSDTLVLGIEADAELHGSAAATNSYDYISSPPGCDGYAYCAIADAEVSLQSLRVVGSTLAGVVQSNHGDPVPHRPGL